MRETLLSFIRDYEASGRKSAFAHRPSLRISRWSGQRIATTAYRFARELESQGIGRGDRVLFWAPNSPELVAAFFGCMLRGVIVVPLDKLSAPDFVARVCEQTEPKLMLLSSNRLDTLAADVPALTIRILPLSAAWLRELRAMAIFYKASLPWPKVKNKHIPG